MTVATPELLQNDVLLYPKDGTTRRVVALPPGRQFVFVYTIKKDWKGPEIFDRKGLIADLQDGMARLCDQPSTLQIESKLTPSAIKTRDRAWELIEPLLEHGLQLFHPSTRWALVEKRAKDAKTTPKTVIKHLFRYWERGMTINALLPSFDLCGGKGKGKTPSKGVKLGRPRKRTENYGVNVTPALRRIFQQSADRTYLRREVFTLREAYRDMLSDYFDRNRSRKKGRSEPSDAEIRDQPTFEQFRYWFEKDNAREKTKRKRMGGRKYDLDLRGLVGTATASARGPGHCMIDATIVDIYLVSRLDRKKIVGRPTLYIVIDTFSRLILGFYVSLESPSYTGAMMALASCSEDKSETCRRFQIEYVSEEWALPCLPRFLLGDNGEMKSHFATALARDFGIDLGNAASYRADWKSIVEARFKLLPAVFGPYCPGYIEPDFKIRGGTDYRQHGVLDLYEFTQIIIECIRYYNNHHAIKNYDRSHHVAEDQVLPVPMDLWNWGIKNVAGSLIRPDPRIVKFLLLPEESAVITAQGIRFRRQYYTTGVAESELWFDRARQTSQFEIKVRYDPRDLDEIYVADKTDKRPFHVCTKTDRSRDCAGLSLVETELKFFYEAKQLDEHRPFENRARTATNTRIKKIVAGAESKRPDTSGISNQSRVAGIKKNRAEEKAAIRKEEIWKLGARSAEPPCSSNVIPIKRPAFDAYGDLSLDEMTGGDHG